jgi:hypothetical protein
VEIQIPRIPNHAYALKLGDRQQSGRKRKFIR